VVAFSATRRVLGPTGIQASPLGKSFHINKLKLVMSVRFPELHHGRHVMIAMLQFATLVITTMFAAAAAAGLHWLCLEAAFLMMRPATARRIPARAELARGTAQLVRAYSAQR
jgi:hypothetical protein